MKLLVALNFLRMMKYSSNVVKLLPQLLSIPLHSMKKPKMKGPRTRPWWRSSIPLLACTRFAAYVGAPRQLELQKRKIRRRPRARAAAQHRGTPAAKSARLPSATGGLLPVQLALETLGRMAAVRAERARRWPSQRPLALAPALLLAPSPLRPLRDRDRRRDGS